VVLVLFEHPAELARKVPMSSKERRRKRREFFDRLPK
jgi:hypothetical protein